MSASTIARHFILSANTKVNPYLMGAAAGSLGPAEHRVPEVLALPCGLDTSEAVYTWILAVWGPLCSFPLVLERTRDPSFWLLLCPIVGRKTSLAGLCGLLDRFRVMV